MRTIHLLLVYPLIVLAACAREVPPPATTVASSRVQLDSVRRDATIKFFPGSSALSAPEAERLRTIVADLGGPDGLRAVIRTSAEDPLAVPRSRSVARALSSSGLVTTSRDPLSARDQVAIKFIRYVARAAPCPTIAYTSPAADGELIVRAQGCTTANNLVAMLADPGDLVAPHGHGAFDAVPAAAAVARYRNDQITPLMVTPDLPIGSTPGAPSAGNGATNTGATAGSPGTRP